MKKRKAVEKCYTFTTDEKNRDCIIITREQGKDEIKKLKEKAGHLINDSRKALIIGTTIIGISLYSGPLSAKEIEAGRKASSSSISSNYKENLHTPFTVMTEQNYIGSKEKIILPYNQGMEYEKIYELSEGMARVKIGGKYGYLNDWGNLTIPPQFDDALNFSEELAGVKIGEKWGYIDKSGKITIELQFKEAGNFSEGLAVVKIDEKYGYINKFGIIVIEPQFDKAMEFSEGLAFVEAGEECGYIDKTGKYIHFGKVRPDSQSDSQDPQCELCTGGCVAACTLSTGCSWGCQTSCTSCTGCISCTVGCTRYLSNRTHYTSPCT